MQNTLLRNTFDTTLVQPNDSSKFKKILTYISLLLFIALVVFISAAVNKFVIDTMSISFTPESSNLQESGFSQIITVKKGDTLKAILFEQNIAKEDVEKIIKLAQDGKLSSSLKIGQKITFEYETTIVEQDTEDLTTESTKLNKIIVEVDKLKFLEIVRRENDNFIVQDIIIPLDKEFYKSTVVINSSFMEALKSLGLSSNSIVELINAYAYQIDFQRQIKKGDTVSVITEKFSTKEGEFSHYGKVLYVSLISSGKEYSIYRYSPDDSVNNQVFFSEDGKSAKRSLLRTPLKVVRVSSHYGNRKHPTLGYTKMHRGVDFAAPTGTPIYAAGNGVITEIGWKSGYGKFIQIKHSGTLSTAYAHASSFTKNLKIGSVVKQGDVIALVGATGRATGPHLHYEVKIDGKNVNPMSVKTTPGVELRGKQLAKFAKFKQTIKGLNTSLDDKSNILSALN